MNIPLLVLLFFIVIVPVVLACVIPIYLKHRKVSAGIVNHDAFMRRFVYKVSLTGSEILDRLQAQNAEDELSCTVDSGNSSMVFSEGNSSKEYFYQIREYEVYSILTLTQAARISASSYIQYKLNPFMIDKLNAEIVPYSSYAE